MKETIFLIIGLALCTSGVILIYDARSITKKLFSFGDQNEATSGLKIIGFVISIITKISVFCKLCVTFYKNELY